MQQLPQQVGRGRKKESKGREGGRGGEKRNRQERVWPAGTEQQLVTDSEKREGGKEKATRGEREREREKHLQTVTMGMDDKRMRVFVYNVSTGGEMFSLVLLSEKHPQVLIFF